MAWTRIGSLKGARGGRVSWSIISHVSTHCKWHTYRIDTLCGVMNHPSITIAASSLRTARVPTLCCACGVRLVWRASASLSRLCLIAMERRGLRGLCRAKSRSKTCCAESHGPYANAVVIVDQFQKIAGCSDNSTPISVTSRAILLVLD